MARSGQLIHILTSLECSERRILGGFSPAPRSFGVLHTDEDLALYPCCYHLRQFILRRRCISCRGFESLDLTRIWNLVSPSPLLANESFRNVFEKPAEPARFQKEAKPVLHKCEAANFSLFITMGQATWFLATQVNRL